MLQEDAYQSVTRFGGGNTGVLEFGDARAMALTIWQVKMVLQKWEGLV